MIALRRSSDRGTAVSGSLAHNDSMGNQAVIVPGEVQRMTAGTGVVHSEFNEKKDETVHLLQIWIQPNRVDLTPGYEQKSFEKQLNSKSMVLVASQDAREGSVAIHQDASLYVSRLQPGGAVDLGIQPGRKVWLQLVKGKMRLKSGEASVDLAAGDAVAVTGESALRFESLEASEALVFDLP